MAKKKTTFNQAAVVREVLEKNPDATAKEAFDLARKAYPKAPLKFPAFRTAYNAGKNGATKAAVARRTDRSPAETRHSPTPIGRNMQSIASALEAASALIRAAGGVDRASKLVDDVEGLIAACGTADDAKTMLAACGKLLECQAGEQGDDSPTAIARFEARGADVE